MSCTQKLILDTISDDVLSDNKYLNTITEILFDDVTLANSSVTGVKKKSKEEFECNKLDANKISFLKGKEANYCEIALRCHCFFFCFSYVLRPNEIRPQQT
jgi:hypothetical protein